MARVTLSRSPSARRPAWLRLRTISRIASSLPVALRSTMIASRTTKSESFIRPSIHDPPGQPPGDSRRGPQGGCRARRPARVQTSDTADLEATDRGSSPRPYTTRSVSQFGRQRQVGRGRRRAALGDGAAVVLDPLLVAAELVLDLVDAPIHRGLGGRGLLVRHEVVLVLGGDEDLD